MPRRSATLRLRPTCCRGSLTERPRQVRAVIESILVRPKRTPLDELTARLNSRAQAKFYIEHAGQSFDWYEAGHDAYQGAVESLRRALPVGVKSQVIERSYLSTFHFSFQH